MDNNQQSQTPNTSGITWDNAPAQQQSQGQSQPQEITWDDDQTQASPSDEITVNPDDDLATKAAKYGLGTLEGIGEGVFGTAAGATDLLGGKGTGFSKALHEAAGDNNQQHGVAQEVGQGMETIGEFILGDEALKGLSLGDKLKKSASMMKIIEGLSPRFANALRLGINVGKAGAELTPEERSLVQAHPVLARLVGVGLDAIRQGGVQSIQTGIKTGGNVEESAKSGAGMALGSAALGAPLGVAGGLLAKGGEAAEDAAKLRSIAEGAPTSTDANNALQTSVQGAMQPTIDQAQAAKGQAEGTLNNLSTTIQNITDNAPDKNELTNTAQQYAEEGKQKIHDDYLQTLNEIRNDPALQGATIPGTGSAFQQRAGEAAFGKEQGDAIRKALGAKIPGSPEVMNLVTQLAKPGGLLDLDEAKLPKQLDINSLINYAKDTKEQLRKVGYSTPQDMRDRDIYYHILDGIHQSIDDLVTGAGKPKLMDKLQNMNQAYKEGIDTFKNPDVKKILAGSNENAIINTITGGKSVGDIQAIRKGIGNQAFGQLSDQAMSRLAQDSINPTTGEFDLSRWIRNMNNIPESVRDEMADAGAFKSGILNNILDQARSISASGVIENSNEAIKNAQDAMTKIMGNSPDVMAMLKKPEKVKMLSDTIGPEAMGALGDTILRNQLREAATEISKKGEVKVGSVSTGKFINFVNELKDSPEVVNAFFKPTPERAQAYAKLLQSANNVEGVKTMIKLGIIAPTLGAAAGGAIGHSVWAALLGSIAAEGAGGYFSKARDLLDYLANHPRVWSTLKSANNFAERPATKAVSNLARIAAGKAVASPSLRDILSGTSSQLSNQ